MLAGDIMISWPQEELQPDNIKDSLTAGPQARPGTLRVLVVDDDYAIKVVVTAMLEVLGCRVDRAEDGVKALDCMAARHYDLVLTDLNMPAMDGFSLACTIRRRRQNTKIVIMTGTCKDDVQSMVGAGQVNAWLFKPFSMREVRQLINRFESL
jgi:CheY-like chemotaxis protein